MELEEDKNRILSFAEGHPYVLLASIAILVIVILIMYFNSRGYNVMGLASGKKSKKKKSSDADEDTVDELIDDIESKQKDSKK
jgi:cytochrome c-type biogenesis protein CcmH/NrfG